MRSLALDGQVAPERDRVVWTRWPDYRTAPDACDGRLRWPGQTAQRCVLIQGHDGDHVFETFDQRNAREAAEYAAGTHATDYVLEIPPTQVAPQVTQTLVSGTPLMPDGTYTEFTFVDHGRGPLSEADLQLGARVRVDCRPHQGPLIEGTIVNLSFEVRSRKTLVRVRS